MVNKTMSDKRMLDKTTTDLREQVLSSVSTLRLPISSQALDASLREAEQSGRSHLEFLQSLLAPAAAGRRQRSIERRIREAHFHEVKVLEDFDASSLKMHSTVSHGGSSFRFCWWSWCGGRWWHLPWVS